MSILLVQCMHRENKKGEQIDWQLLYIADPDYLVKPPFLSNGMKLKQSGKRGLRVISNHNLLLRNLLLQVKSVL